MERVEKHPLWRELFTGLDEAPIPRRNVLFWAWIHVLVISPFIYGSVFLAGLDLNVLSNPSYPPVFVYACKLWAVLAVVVFLSNIMALMADRRGSSMKWLQFFSAVTLFGNLATNFLSTWPMGLLTSQAPFYLVVIVAGYRIILGYRFGIAALIGAVMGFLGVFALELSAMVPVHPLFPDAIIPYYELPPPSFVIAFPIPLGLMLGFVLSNYIVNQNLKLNRYISRSVLGRYLPPALARRAETGEFDLDAPPEKMIVTIIFADMVGFTQLSESLPPDQLARVVSGFLKRMSSVAHSHGATVDKFVGDCVMLVLGAPEPLEPHEQARRAAALCRQALDEMRQPVDGIYLQARIGVNTGQAVVGNFGSEVRSDYTVIGPTVNIAARLEAQSQGGRVLLGENTATLLGEDEVRGEAVELALKGVSKVHLARFLDLPQVVSVKSAS